MGREGWNRPGEDWERSLRGTPAGARAPPTPWGGPGICVLQALIGACAAESSPLVPCPSPARVLPLRSVQVDALGEAGAPSPGQSEAGRDRLLGRTAANLDSALFSNKRNFSLIFFFKHP